MARTGVLLCLGSAAAFGTMGIFGKLAYDAGATVGTLLAVRFALAAAVFWVLVVASGAARRVSALPRRDVGLALGLGAVGYSAQAGCYFAALQRIDASLLALLVYTFPAIVTVAAIVLGRDRASGRTALALGFACAGLILVLAGSAAGALDPLGVALGLTAAVVYSAYILVSEGVAIRLDALTLSALVCTGAAVSLTVSALALGDLDLSGVGPEGLGWLAAIALVSTVAAITLFFGGLGRVGPTAASILSTLEPVVTIGLAFVVFGESLGPAQLAGGALVLVAVVAVRVPVRARAAELPRGRQEPAAQAPT